MTFPVAAWFSTYGEGEGRCLAAILVDVRKKFGNASGEFSLYARFEPIAGRSGVARNPQYVLSYSSDDTEPEQERQPCYDADFSALTVLVNGLASIAAFDLDKKKQPEARWIELNRIFEQLRIVIEPDWSENEGSGRMATGSSIPASVCGSA